MIILAWILAAFVTMLLALLVTPFVLLVNTRTASFEVRWGWIGSFCLLLAGEPWRYRARLLFVPWSRSLDAMLDEGTSKHGPSVREQPEPASGHARRKGGPVPLSRLRWMLRAVWNVLRTGRVRHFRCRLDTDDVMFNAWLFPLLHLWRLRGADVAVRFSGGTELSLALSHTPLRALWAVVHTR